VTGCRANYQWSLEVTYSVDGDPSKHTYVAGPYRTLGFADKTQHFTRAMDGTFTSTGTLNGPSKDGWCTERQARHPVGELLPASHRLVLEEEEEVDEARRNSA
jgi:hypothetical protein